MLLQMSSFPWRIDQLAALAVAAVYGSTLTQFDTFEQSAEYLSLVPLLLAASLPSWVYLFGTQFRGRPTGVVAVVALALMPGMWRVEILNSVLVPLAALHVATAYFYWLALTRKHWALALGAAYGVSLYFGQMFWLVPTTLLIHWFWRNAGLRAEGAQYAFRPDWLLLMTAVGLPIFFIVTYLAPNDLDGGPGMVASTWPSPLPWLVNAVPLVTLILMVVGFARASRALTPEFVERLIPGLARLPGYRDTHRTAALWFTMLFGSLITVAVTQRPAPNIVVSFPFIALFAGLAVHEIAKRVRAFAQSKSS